MSRVGHVPRTGVAAALTAVSVFAAVAIAGAVSVPIGPSPSADEGYVLAAPLLVVGAVTQREGLGALVAWIAAGAVFGGAAGYVVHGALSVPLSELGVVGMGAALGGGLGGLVNFVSVGEADRDPEPGVTVDMGRDEAPEPRPADLFEDHPDPVLYVADEGGGPVVRAANDAFGTAFDLPTTTLAGAPLEDALVATEDADDVVTDLADGESIDRELALDTVEGERQYRVRSVGDPADGYVLFTPVGGA